MADSTNDRRRQGEARGIGINFPPIDDSNGNSTSTLQATNDPNAGDDATNVEGKIHPALRSVLELSNIVVQWPNQLLRGSPGYQGGVLLKGKIYCLAAGFRDSTRSLDIQDKGNLMRLRDPLVLGQLSLPIATAYLCELQHQGKFNWNTPLIDYLPELHEKVDRRVTGRTIMSFTTVLPESTILKEAGAQCWRASIARKRCQTMQECVYSPLRNFLMGSNAGSSMGDGSLQRANLVQYIRSSRRVHGFRQLRPGKAQISHFSIALLIAAVERQLKGKTFEETMRKNFFERVQAFGADYGAPKLWRHPNDLFYVPLGQSSQHQLYRTAVPKEAPQNCAPAVFNASLNLYAPPEEYGKLLLLSLDTLTHAREVLDDKQKARKAFYDMGLMFIPRRRAILINPAPLQSIVALPTESSFIYKPEVDVGTFSIMNCGARRASFISGVLTRTLLELVMRHIIKREQHNKASKNAEPDAEKHAAELEKTLEPHKLENFFPSINAHRKY